MTDDQFTELQRLINRNFDMIGHVYEEHSGRFDQVDERLAGVEGRLSGVEGRLSGVEGRMDRLEREVADARSEWTARFDGHETRIRLLEGGG